MAKALARITGTVLDTEVRSGQAKATGNDYTIRTTSVLVLNRAIMQVTLDDSTPVPAIGASVDWLVDMTTFRNEVQARFVSDFPSEAGKRSAPSAA